MYISYPEYEAISLKPISNTLFAKVEPEAETYLDYWTQDRTRGLDPVTDDVKRVMAHVIDGLATLDAAKSAVLGGESVSSYSNGVDSFGFDTPVSSQTIGQFEEDMEHGLYRMAVRILPASLISAVVPCG